MRAHMAWPATLAVGLAASCGGGGGMPPSSPDAGGGGRGTYPAGPYGTRNGNVLVDLSFTGSGGSPLALHDLHADASVKLIMIETSAGWCRSCIEALPAIEDLYGRYRARGLRVVEALFEDADSQPATVALAAMWKQQYHTTFDVVIDPPAMSGGPFQLSQYYDRTLTPMIMFADAGTMQILRVSTGWDQSAAQAIVMARLQ